MGSGSKYLGIVEALTADVRAGVVREGDRLPAQRAVAEALGVDLTTVTRAFNEARRRGLIEAQPGRHGTFVKAVDVAAQRAMGAAPTVDMSMNIPPQPAAADLGRRLVEGIASVLGSNVGVAHLHYQESAGSEPDRAAAAVWLGQFLGAVPSDRILVACGAQGALFAVCEALLRPGDALCAGAVTYPGIRSIAAQRGFSLLGLAMDEEGIRPDAFEACCRNEAPRALYVVPTIDNPTTATMSEARRREIVEIARRYGVSIVEDDPYRMLPDAAPRPIATLAPELTWHLSTLSKCATPGLRIAYVACPDKIQALRLAGVLRATTLMAPPLMAALASRFIADGTLSEIVAAIRGESAARQAIAAEALKGVDFAADPFGHHLWLSLPPGCRATDFAAGAGRSGLAIVPSSAFAVGKKYPEAARVSLGLAQDRKALREALDLLAALVSDPSLFARAVV
ncbi:Transcriptional regulator, GntR family domain / Aspartate aminotransferase [Minicystis rosea]|nr:Transcriptional regulator, GntR family domain / Aspartate aminotransferase [Minicystis rosea]